MFVFSLHDLDITRLNFWAYKLFFSSMKKEKHWQVVLREKVFQREEI